jgi:excisionase family DNA binding protein
MLTVPQAAARVGRDPETIRRWIRSGRLRAEKVGTQHLIDERHLDALVGEEGELSLPHAWEQTWTGEPQPDWVKTLRRSRMGR